MSLHPDFIESGLKIAEGALFMGMQLNKMTREELLAVAAVTAKAYTESLAQDRIRKDNACRRLMGY